MTHQQSDDLDFLISLLLPLIREMGLDDLLYVIEEHFGREGRDAFELEALLFLERQAMDRRFAAPLSKDQLS